MGERSGINDLYRFGYNGQERTDEISGNGNHNTAQFWEYDTRMARRWNVDPVDQVSISNYGVNGLNPIIYKDPLENFKTKFGAKIASFFNRGKQHTE